MIVYFSTVVRTAPLELGGEVVKLDWSRKEILARAPVIPVDPMIPDPNPRGGTRGGRGILLGRDRVYVASYHTIHAFDDALRPVGSFTNPLFADLHELAWEGDSIWASSTVLDGAIKIDRRGNMLDGWWPREDPVIAGCYRLPPLPLDKGEDNRLSYLGRSHVQPGHTHLNTVTMLDGRPLVLLNNLGCLVRLNPTEILVEDQSLKGAHNILVTSDGHILVNDTRGHRVLVYDAEGALRSRIMLGKYWPVRKIRWRFGTQSVRIWVGERIPSFKLHWLLVGNIIASRPVFVRGLCETERGTAIVGISPASLLEIDWRSGELVDYFRYSDDINAAVHGLAFLKGEPSDPAGRPTSPKRAADEIVAGEGLPR